MCTDLPPHGLEPLHMQSQKLGRFVDQENLHFLNQIFQKNTKNYGNKLDGHQPPTKCYLQTMLEICVFCRFRENMLTKSSQSASSQTAS